MRTYFLCISLTGIFSRQSFTFNLDQIEPETRAFSLLRSCSLTKTTKKQSLPINHMLFGVLAESRLLLCFDSPRRPEINLFSSNYKNQLYCFGFFGFLSNNKTSFFAGNRAFLSPRERFAQPNSNYANTHTHSYNVVHRRLLLPTAQTSSITTPKIVHTALSINTRHTKPALK